MSDFLKVQGEEGLYRDPTSNAIINKDKQAWANHKIRKRKLQEKEQKIQSLEADVEELKELVQMLINDKTKAKTKSKKSTKSE